ncbi:hypothetical protein Tco_1571633, partial [Tanacetum coccineum]
CSYHIITNGFPYNLEFIYNGLICKCKLQMQPANETCKCKLQMQAKNACLQMLACKCLLANASLQMQAANQSCKPKLQTKAANASLQMLARYPKHYTRF